jgi:hypothetical protein
VNLKKKYAQDKTRSLKEKLAAGTHFTCFPSRKVQILTRIAPPRIAPPARAQKNKKDAGKEKTEKNEKTEAEGPTEELFCCGHNGFFFLAFANAKQTSLIRRMLTYPDVC